MKEFDAEIVIGNNGLKFAHVPFDAKEAFGIDKGKLPVRGEVNGQPYRSKLIPKGNGKQIIVLSRELQKAIGFADGMKVHFTMDPDTGKSCDAQAPNLLAQSGVDVVRAITERRSIRKYLKRTVEDDKINTILNAGFCAPSAKNKRPWHFIAVRERDALERIASAGKYTDMIAQAPLCIAICGDKIAEGMAEFLHQDCGAAAQNMLLCAHALGLGAVWCGVPSNLELQKKLIALLNLPAKVIPVAIIAIGYPDEEKSSEQRYESSKVHYETW